MRRAVDQQLPPRLRQLRDRLRGDDGGSVSLELIVIFPVVLMFIVGLVQGAFYFYARHMAMSAARQGLRAEQVNGATTDDGRVQALNFLNQSGSSKVMSGVNIDPARTATQASVTVTATSYSIIPGIGGITFHQTATGPVERYQTAGG